MLTTHDTPPLSKHVQVSCTWTVPEGETASYALIPCAFRPKKEGEFLVTVYSTQPCELVPTEPQAESLLVNGEWKVGETAGGCINHGSWINNPHCVLASTKPTKVTLLLIQQPDQVDPTGAEPMGLYITHSDEYNRPIVTSPEDIVAKSEFQATQDLSMEFWLEPSERPLIVTPCTFHPDRELAYSLQVFTERFVCVCVCVFNMEFNCRVHL
jgi:Calpain large subunit, domain III